MLPKASIVVLSHRWRTHPEMVQQCLDSARSQTYQNLQIVTQFDEALWPTKLNDAVAAAQGEFVAILCDDDMLHPEYTTRCMEAAQFADIVYTDRMVFQDGQHPQEGFDFRMHGESFARGNVYRVRMTPDTFAFGASLPMTMMVRKTLWDELEGYKHMPHADTEFWFRAIMRGARTVYIPEPLFWYREHSHQESRMHDTMALALEAFHRDHFPIFGFAYPEAKHEAGKVHVPIIPKAQRRSYAERFHIPFNEVENMAQETRALPDIAKSAFVMARQNFDNQMGALAAQALASAGLSPNDGWTVDGANLTAVRAMPDPVAPSGPVLVADAPVEVQATPLSDAV